MKVKSFLLSLLLILGGSAGAFVMSFGSLSTQAVSVDASVWDGTYATSVNTDDVDILGYNSSGNETSLSSATTIRIYTAKGFSYFAGQVTSGNTYANKTIYLECDIDLDNRVWTPMGGTNTYFMGTFDGNNNTIYNLTNNSTYSTFGLFARVEGTVRNINLVSVNISYTGTLSSSHYVGAVAGEVHGGTISGVSVRGNISSRAYNSVSYVGGLVGYAYDAGVNDDDTSNPATIENSSNYATVSGISCVGGLIGATDGDVDIVTSFNRGTISNNQNSSTQNISVGGLVGRESVTTSKYLSITNSYNNGDITLNASTNNVDVKAGGLLGSADSIRSGSSLFNYFNFKHVYNAGDFNVSGYSSASNRSVYVAGLVGFADRPVNVFTNDSLISYAFNIGDLVSLDGSSKITSIGSRLHFREIMGTTISNYTATGVSQNDVYFDYDAPYQIFYNSSAYNDLRNMISVPHLDGKATSYEFLSTMPNKAAGVYGVNFSFYNGTSGYWLLSETVNDGLPYLYTTLNNEDANNDWDNTVSGAWQGEGTLSSPYLIYTAEDLSLIADRYNSGVYSETSVTYFSLQNDIDLSSKAWEPIGINNYSFRYAVFDGNGHTISGINCSLQVDYNQSVGLFGTIENAVVRNVIIEDFRFVGSANYTLNRATLVGNAVQSYIINCRDNTGFTNDYLTGISVYTIANASASYLIYGSNNVEGASYTAGMENLSTTAQYLTRGVETYLNTEGGAVYDDVISTESREITPHLGDGKFVVVNGDIISVTLNSGSKLYDRTYMTTLPVDTIEAYSDVDLDNSFYIVKEGYKIDVDGYNCNGTLISSLSGTNSYLDLINLGITAVWQSEEDVEFKVYYNSYEKYWNERNSANYANIGLDKDVSTYMPYNSFNSFSGLRENINSAISSVERENFEVAGVYENFSDGVYSGTNILSAEESNTGYFFNTDDNYYLKWQGTDDKVYTFTINFSDTALEAGGYPDRYEWTEAIDEVVIYFNSTLANGTVGVVEREIYDIDQRPIVDDQIIFNYSTDAVDEYFESIEISVKLKFGFTFDMASYSNAFFGPSNIPIPGNSSYSQYVDTYGSAFYTYPSPSSVGEWNDDTKAQEVVTYTFGQAIGNAGVNLEIARSSNTFKLNVGAGVYYALTLPETTLNSGFFEVFTGEGEDGFIPLQEYNYEFFLSVSNQLFGFRFALNMFDNYMLSTVHAFDMESTTDYVHFNGDKNYNGLLVRMRFPENPQNEQYKYYLFEFGEVLNEGVSTMTQTLYLVEEAPSTLARVTGNYRSYNGFNFEIIDRIASIEQPRDATENSDGSMDYNVNFYTNQEFGLVFSTESAENYMVEYSGNKDSTDYRDATLEVLMPVENISNNNLQKIYYDFAKAKDNGENFYSVSVYLGLSSDSEADELVTVSQTRITAKVTIQFVDESGNIISGTDEMPLPVIYLSLNATDDAVQNVEKWTRYTQGSQITISPLSSQSMTLRIVNNEYYQWNYRKSSTDNTAVDFGELTGQSIDGVYSDDDPEEGLVEEGLNDNLYLNITQNGRMFDAKDKPFKYEAGELSDYFAVAAPTDSSGAIMGTTGMIYESEKTAFDFNMYYNEAWVPSGIGQQQRELEALPNYDFTLTFVLKDVDYSVNIETKFKQTAESELYDDDTNFSQVFSGSVSGTTIDIGAHDGFGMRTLSNVVSASSTRDNSANGYTFAGFQIVTDGEEDTVISEYVSHETEKTYRSMVAFLDDYNEYLNYESSGDSYAIDLQAIYISNTVEYEASGSNDLTNITDGRTIVENYNGTTSLRYLSQGISESRGLGLGTYYYGNSGTGESDDLGTGDFEFEMNEYYSNRYDFTGVALMDETSYLLASGNYDESMYLASFDADSYSDQITIETNLNRITVDGDLIKDYFKNNIGSLAGQKIYIVPIVEQRTLIISITSGGNGNELVYDNIGNETTFNEVQLQFYYNSATNIEFNKEYLKNKEDEYESYYLVSTQDSVILNDYFNKKSGYQTNGWLVYNSNESEATPIYINYYRIDENFFAPEYIDEQGVADYRIHIERNYSSNSYYINYSSGDERVEGSTIFGISTGSTSSTLASYGEETVIAENGFVLTGYTFLNWNTSIDGSGDSFEAGETITESLCTGENGNTAITLYAQWTAKEYDVEVIFNGGTVEGSDAESMIIENVSYNTRLSMLSSIVPTRAGFTFDGFYTMAPSGTKSDYYLVDEYSYLNSAIYGFNDVEGNVAVTIYATWRFTGDVNYSVEDNTKEFTYTGSDISSPISDYVFDGINLTFSFNDFTVTSAFPNVEVSYEVTGATFDGNNIILSRPNVGNYYVYLNLTLLDISEFYPTGEIASIRGEFIFIINPADIGFSYSDDYSLYYENIKYLVSLVESEAEISKFESYGSFTVMMNSLKTDGVLSSTATVNNTYEYLFMKYYNMINNRIYSAESYDMFITYRNWTYDEYLTYYDNTNYFSSQYVTGDDVAVDLTGVRATRASVLQAAFLLSYDVNNRISTQILYGTDASTIYNVSQFVLTSPSAVSVASDLYIDTIEVISSYEMRTNSSYEVRAYLSASSGVMLDNYNLQMLNIDGENKYYINLPNAYMLLQILKLDNNSTINSRFYNINATEIEVEYIGENQDTYLHVLDRQYYTQLEENSTFYVNVNIYTSNTGNSEQDTIYNFYTPENHFDFSSYQVLSVVGDVTTNVTSDVNLLLSEEFSYIIYNVKNTAQITLNPVLFTKVDDYREVVSLDEQYYDNLFSVTRFTYSLDGVNEITVENDIGLADGRYYSEEGVLLFEITGNNTGSPVIISTDPLTSIVIQVPTILDEYIRLIDIGQYEATSFEGDGTRTSGEYEFDLSDDSEEIAYEEGVVTEVDYYATYSDLVKFFIDYNLPVNNDEFSSYIQLGQDTSEDIVFPYTHFLTCERLSYLASDGTEQDYSTIFTGLNGTYVGVTDNIFEPINLKAYWEIGYIGASSRLMSYRQSVGTLESVYAYETCMLDGTKSELFDYNFEIIYRGEAGEVSEVVAQSSNFNTLAFYPENGGTVEDNGIYQIRITVTMKEEYRYILSDPENYQIVNEEVTFEIDLQPIKIIGIEYVGQQTITYDGQEHNNSFSLDVSYVMYDELLADYNTENVQVVNYVFEQEGMFSITINDGQVTSIKDVGEYTIDFSIDESYYIYEGDVTTSFTLNIVKAIINLENEEIYLSKKFNTADPTLDYNLSINGETLQFNLNRTSGEDIGNYNLYLNEENGFVCSNLASNYQIVYGDVTLYDNSLQNLDTPVGDFEIIKSDTLRLSWEGLETIMVNYNTSGYSLQINDGNVVVYSGDSQVSTRALIAYDVNAGAQIVDNFALIESLLNYDNITLLLYNSLNYETAFDSATYELRVEVKEGAEIANYYNNIIFDEAYTFEIFPMPIDVSEFSFNKVYDGNASLRVDLEGNIVGENYEGVYINANFSTYHAGENISVTLVLSATEGYNENNYTLSSVNARGTILKRDAVLNISALYEEGESAYTYGDLSRSNLEDNLSLTVMDTDGVTDLSDIFFISTYTLSLDLEGADANRLGFFYQGTYSVTVVSSSFADFNMTNITSDTVEIAPYEFALTLPENYITITTVDLVSTYSDIQTYAVTGDAMTLSYIPEGLTQGELGAEGQYNLLLNGTNSFVNGSIIITLSAQNSFQIVPTEEIIFLKFEDTSLLNLDYNGYDYLLRVEDNKLVIENGQASPINLTFNLYRKTGTGDEAFSGNITTINIYLSGNVHTFKDAGNYRLYLTLEAEGATNFAFYENYYLTVDAIEVNPANLNLTKTYDGTNRMENIDFDERVNDGVVNDEVSITAIFATSQVGTDINVTLYLNGTSARNYRFMNDNNIALGEIVKADAVIALTNNTFRYGSLQENSGFSYTVTSGENIVSTTEYSVSATINNGSYSASGYLTMGDYSVSLVIESNNYNITPTELNFSVTPFNLNFTFTTDGAYRTSYGSEESLMNQFVRDYNTIFGDTIEITFTRGEGSAVGYYKILSASVVDENYVVESVQDLSANGAYRITPSNERFYLLISSSDVVDGDDNSYLNMELTYDGLQYSNFTFEVDEQARNYKITLSSTTSSITHEYILNLYSYNEEENVYVKSSSFDETLDADLRFTTNAMVKNAGDYSVYADNITSTNFDVIFGKPSTLSAYVVRILPKELTYNVAGVSKEFDNHNAVLFYEDASEILNGIISGETLSLTLTMYDGITIARYVGDNYTVQAVLSDNVNYVVTGEIHGEITKAKVGLYIDSVSVTYGQQPTYYYEINYGDLDLTYYDKSNISVDIGVVNGEYSTSNNLKVNEEGYELSATLNARDFEIGYYYNSSVDNTDVMPARLYVTPRTLIVEQKDDALLKDIFTKLYDGSNSVVIRNESNELLFNIGNLISGDIVDVESAFYAQTLPGSGIQIDFNIIGDDAENYSISSYLNGEIKAILLYINFDYQADEGETISANIDETKLLESVNYPFIATNYLSSNATDGNKNAFPTMLTGKEGFTFNGWTINLSAPENTPEWTYLSDVLSRLGLNYTSNAGVYRISVGNNSSTILFLTELMSNDVDYFNIYESEETARVTFTANWIGNSYYFTVYMQDANGENLGGNYAEYANIAVNDEEMISSTYQTSVNHGDSVEIIITLSAYVRLSGVFDSLTGEEYTFDSVVTEGNVTTYTINSVTSENALAFRFSYDNVSIVLDLTGYNGEVTFSDDRFIPLTDNRYVYTASCQNLLDADLTTLPDLSRAGYSVVGYLFNNEVTVDASDFATTLLLSNSVQTENGYELTYSPIFEELNIEVILDYNYDSRTVTISVPFNGAFGDAEGWEETPIREGYEFVSWTDEEGNVVTGDTILTNPNGVTLTANWNILQNYITLSLDENLSLISASVDISYDRENNLYIFDALNFDEILSFTLQVNEGYEVDIISYTQDDILFENVEFEETDNGAIVNFNMPAPPYVKMSATSAVKRNDVTVQGEHFSFTASVDGSLIEITNNTFSVDSDVTFDINITIEDGYEFVNIETNNSDIGIEQVMNGSNILLTISGIRKDTLITVLTTERENRVVFTFDNADALNRLITNDQTNVDNIAYVRTGDNLNVYLSLKEGYLVNNIIFAYSEGQAQNVAYTLVEDDSNAYFGYYQFTIANILADGVVTIEIGYQTYEITTGVLVYDESGVLIDDEDILSSFTVLVDGETTAIKNYNSTATLTYSFTLDDYSFAGWSRDGSTIISAESPFDITVTMDETIYAIFSKAEFRVALNAYSYYVLNQEYGDSSLEEEVYRLIYAPFFEEETEVYQSNIYYGSSKTIELHVPDGYTFLGYGYILNAEYSQAQLVRGDFDYAYRNQSSEKVIEITLDTLYMLNLGFGAMNNYVPFFVALAPSSIDFNINSYLDFDGLIEEDNSVGDITLIGYEDGVVQNVNEYGYVSGTLNHYKDYNGVADRQNFILTTNTNSEVFLKVGVTRGGYSLSRVVSTNNNLVTIQHYGSYEENGQLYDIYRLFNIVGSVNELDINVYFLPQKNIIDINFKNELGTIVSGGNLFLEIDDAMSQKVWGNGSNQSTLQVVGYTDTYFSIVAYIRLGFEINLENISLSYDDEMLNITDVRGYQLNFAENNYNYVIYFNVSALLNSTEISINLEPQTYRVVLNDISLNNPVIAVIDNVRFHEVLDLSLSNSHNITSNLGYSNGTLNIVQSKEDYTFAGYFTYAGGKGRQYINSTGQALTMFMETGYILNENTGRYELSDNAYIDTDGVMTINLYLYWSFLKTQITFSIMPNIRANITAEDLVEGENMNNSWFNEEMPLYIEVAFNTNITLTAPEIDGYKFYKFVIKQRDANNNYLADVVSFTNNVPWSTNERDRIVEMTIEVYYFAKVNVTLTGGEMEYEIGQASEDMYAEALVNEGYVDTTKEFTLTALESSGYDFNYWYKVATQERFNTRVLTDKIETYANYILAVQGKRVTLSFSEYDATSGYIANMIVRNISNVQTPVTLGHLQSGTFVKDITTYDVRVGDNITFMVRVDYGFGVSWNLDDIELYNIDTNFLYFTMEVTGDMAESVVPIIPEFIGESMAIYIYRSFAEKDIIEGATDNNDANLAGYVTYEGSATDVILRSLGADLTLNIITNARYNITNIEIINYYGELINVLNNFDAQTNTLYFTREEIDTQSLAGTIRLEIEFERLYHEMTDIEEQGTGASDDPYLIYTVEDLTYYMEKINSGSVSESGRFYELASYRVMADISLSEKFWTPIGTTEHAFNGTFNFNGHTISDIYLAKYYNPTSYGGLFGVIGYDARIYRNEQSYWYIYIIIVIIVILIILLIILIIYNKKKKEKREEMNTK